MTIFLLMCLLMCIIQGTVSASGDISFTYDFDIDSLGSDWVAYSTFKNYKLNETETEYGKVLQVGKNSGANLLFGKLINSGMLYISFDYQHNDPTATASVYLGKSANTDLTQITSANNYARTLFFNDGDKTDADMNVTYFDRGSGNDMMSTWTHTDPNVSVGYGEWHNYQIIIRDIDQTSAYAEYYIDGELINKDDPIKCYGAGGFMSLCFWANWTEESGENIYCVDNVVVKSYSTEPEIKLSLEDNKVDEENGVLNVSLDTPVNKDLLIEDNVLITNVNTGEKINNFTLSDVTETTFKVNFSGLIERGKYRLTLNNNVKVPILESIVKSSVEFRTAWKSQNVNGVDIVIPDVNEIIYYDVSGNRISDSTTMSSFVSKIDIVFNTIIDEETAKNNIVLKGEATGITTSLNNVQSDDDENYSVYSIMLNEFLNGDTAYILSINPGIASAIETTVLSENTYSSDFTTLDDEAFITDNGKWNDNEYAVSFYKNTDEELKSSVLLCGYKTVSVNGEDCEQLVGCEYIPINIDGAKKGVFSYSKEVDFNEQSEYIKIYFWNYPSMDSILVDDSGILK